MNADNSKNSYRIDNIKQLQWACRRGMLELDVLLGNFLAEAYPHLPMVEQKQFVELLNCTDTELFAWLMGREIPDDSGLLHITEAIRRHARSRI